MTSRQLAKLLAARIGYGFTQRDLAKELEISAAYLCDFLQGRREAGPAILTALGYDPMPHYFKRKKRRDRVSR